MAKVTVAAVQAAYVLMDREATVRKTEDLLREAAAKGAELVVFPEAFIPGTPIWIDKVAIWDDDAAWFKMLPTRPSWYLVRPPSGWRPRRGRPVCTWSSVSNERERLGNTIYNTLLYFAPDGTLLGKHRKLMPTGSERTVWGMGDGSTLDTYPTPFGRIGGLICWENYMPLARFYLYAQGVDIWVAPTLAGGDAWIATMQHIAREGRCHVIGVNPCLHVDQIPADFPDRDRVWRDGPDDGGWVEPGNTVIVNPAGRSSPARPGTPRRSSPRSWTSATVRGATDVRPGRALPPAGRVPALGGHLTAAGRHPATQRPSGRCGGAGLGPSPGRWRGGRRCTPERRRRSSGGRRRRWRGRRG